MGVGTTNGQVLLYDLRSSKPLRTKASFKPKFALLLFFYFLAAFSLHSFLVFHIGINHVSYILGSHVWTAYQENPVSHRAQS
jgi:hypothetical protein